MCDFEVLMSRKEFEFLHLGAKNWIAIRERICKYFVSRNMLSSQVCNVFEKRDVVIDAVACGQKSKSKSHVVRQ